MVLVLYLYPGTDGEQTQLLALSSWSSRLRADSMFRPPAAGASDRCARPSWKRVCGVERRHRDESPAMQMETQLLRSICLDGERAAALPSGAPPASAGLLRRRGEHLALNWPFVRRAARKRRGAAGGCCLQAGVSLQGRHRSEAHRTRLHEEPQGYSSGSGPV